MPARPAFFVSPLAAALLFACSDDGATSAPGANDGGPLIGYDATPTPLVDGASPTAPGADASPGTDASSPPPAATCTPPISPADTSHPTTVVGSGTAASCTAAALATAIAGGGVITFACGGAATIAITTTLAVPTDRDTVIDGGGKVTLDGGGTTRILSFEHGDYRKNTHSLTLQHLTLAHGKASGTKQYPQHPAPCSSGYYDGAGGAVLVNDGVLDVYDVHFVGNEAANVGPDVAGGAIYASGALKGVIAFATFDGNKASNGGAIGLLNSDMDVYDSTFTSNEATGFGANGDDASQCPFLDPVTNQHQTGSGGNGGAVVIDGGSDGTHTFCGVVMRGNKGGMGALGGAIFRTPDISKQTTTIDRSLFDTNTGDSGGALYFHNSNLQIDASTFSANTAAGSGAIQADGTTFTFTNVTFAGNQSSGVGGTLSLFGGNGTLTSCTFSGNHAKDFAAAIFGQPNLAITNTLFVDDTAGGSPAQCQSGGGTTGASDLQWPSGDTACVPGIAFADPKLGALGDHGGPVPTLVPAAGSPALGAGKACPATDARGKARPANGCTVGAVEGSM